MASYNPFARRESHSAQSLKSYRVLVPLTWLVVVVVGVYYSIHSPDTNGRNLWKQALKHETPFSQNNTITGLYWIFLLLSQLSYVWHLFSNDSRLATPAANVASHFVFNNLLLLAWILLWTRNHFIISEIVLCVQVINQYSAYCRYRGLPAFVYLSTVAGPYAWSLTALFWNGAVAVHSHNLPGRIVANVFIWVFFVVGLSDIFFRQDYILGYCLSWLTLSLAVQQVSIKVIALQWIFAFTIFGVLFISSLYISFTKYSGRDSLFRQVAHPESDDRERAPLLNDSVA